MFNFFAKSHSSPKSPSNFVYGVAGIPVKVIAAKTATGLKHLEQKHHFRALIIRQRWTPDVSNIYFPGNLFSIVRPMSQAHHIL